MKGVPSRTVNEMISRSTRAQAFHRVPRLNASGGSPLSSLACDTLCVCVCVKEGVCKEEESWMKISVSNVSHSLYEAHHVFRSARVLLHSVLRSVSPAVSSALHFTGRPAEQALLSGLAGRWFGVRIPFGSRLLPGRHRVRCPQRASVPSFRRGRP